MSNITTDVNSFENIDYPKNIYELLLQLKNVPLELNVNCSSKSESSSEYLKYNSQETLLRVDPLFGEIFTKTFYQELECDFSFDNLPNIPQYFTILEEIDTLYINQIIDFSAKLNDFKKIIINDEFGTTIEVVEHTNFLELNNSIYIDKNKIFLNIPTAYDSNDTSIIVNKDIPPYRKFVSFVTLVYTKINI